MKKLLVLSLAVSALALTGFGQNKFEGHNIILDVPTTQRSTATATVTDLDRSTPMRVTSCDGGATAIAASAGGSATLRTNSPDRKWCFEGEDKIYRITFPGDQYSGPVTYNWIADPPATQAGYYNVRDG